MVEQLKQGIEELRRQVDHYREEGFIYVADIENDRIQVFAP